MAGKKGRYFNIEVKDRKFERSESGLLVKDVILLAEGTWIDSYQQTPCRYKPGVLEKYCSNWKDNGLWGRHPGGAPRSVDEKIGDVRNPRYDKKLKAVVGDLFFHLKSQKSRDIAEMVEAGIINAVSVEIGGTERYNAKESCFEAESIDFYGLAVVDKGACETCLIRHKAANHYYQDFSPAKGQDGTPPQEGDKMDIEELSKIVQDLAQKVAAIEEKLTPKQEEAPEKKPEDEEKELSKKLTDALKKLSEAEERLKKLENTPNFRGHSGSGEAPKFTKTLVSEGI